MAALAVLPSNAKVIIIALTSQAATTPPYTILQFPFQLAHQVTAIGMGEFDRSPAAHLLDVFALANEAVLVYTALGNGTFDPSPRLIQLSVGGFPASPRVFDPDGNGYDDLLFFSGGDAVFLFQRPSPWDGDPFRVTTRHVEGSSGSCGGTPRQLSCLAATLARGSRCVPDVVVVSSLLDTCRFSAHWSLTKSASVIGTSRTGSGIDCGAAATSAGGVLFAITSAVRLELTNLTLARATFSSATLSGSSPIWLDGWAVLALTSVTVADFDNTGSLPHSSILVAPGSGGVASLAGGSLFTATDSIIRGCTAGASGGVAYINGRHASPSSRLTFVRTSIASCSARNGGVVFVEKAGYVTFTDSQLIANFATDNGGVAFVRNLGAVAASNSLFAQGHADIGGVFFVTGSTVAARGNIFTENYARIGGVAAVANTFFAVGALYHSLEASLPMVEYASSGFLSLSNSEFTYNRADYGGLLFSCGCIFNVGTGFAGAFNNANIAGGVVYACPRAGGKPLSGAFVLHGSDVQALAAMTAASMYGSVLATRPISIAWAAPLPDINGIALPSGFPLPSGFAVVLTDAANNSVIDVNIVLSLQVPHPYIAYGGSADVIVSQSPTQFVDVGVAVKSTTKLASSVRIRAQTALSDGGVLETPPVTLFVDRCYASSAPVKHQDGALVCGCPPNSALVADVHGTFAGASPGTGLAHRRPHSASPVPMVQSARESSICRAHAKALRQRATQATLKSVRPRMRASVMAGAQTARAVASAPSAAPAGLPLVPTASACDASFRRADRRVCLLSLQAWLLCLLSATLLSAVTRCDRSRCSWARPSCQSSRFGGGCGSTPGGFRLWQPRLRLKPAWSCFLPCLASPRRGKWLRLPSASSRSQFMRWPTRARGRRAPKPSSKPRSCISRFLARCWRRQSRHSSRRPRLRRYMPCLSGHR
ncbi:uncharacterized protein AMSG_11693 [Thecamonas trahens ATCC 50062]|uniref:Uncharacterized protein n=1 Tax=Thecamonas trahens ATCC 50062 TaxID=461836 RepID=A0A0L0DVI6_THETB|nr:hypothetical protein AMSG_11693 [Thecamonas trahens ATCC 50062]KNC56182.1 hypothetical protein AMSG_11693 [Thecamonas trahens ATCC 50062]|eukprot:XP_013761232.1 hypothetical protein AMSG_11693 [Thecamonas trahens ATCC 50062]